MTEVKFSVVWTSSSYPATCEDGFAPKVRESLLELRGWHTRPFFTGTPDHMELSEVWLLFIYFLM